MRNGFEVYLQATGERVAVLPLTVPIGATVEAFEVAGYAVGWRWADLP